MALIACSECKREVSDKAAACPHCGAPTGGTQPSLGSYYNDVMDSAPPVPVKRSSGLWKWLLGLPVGVLVVLFVIGSCVGNTPEGRERSNKRAAIEQCWKEQAKKSNDPATARFIAGACERMEADARR